MIVVVTVVAAVGREGRVGGYLRRRCAVTAVTAFTDSLSLS